MRRVLICVAVAALFGFAAPTSAATLVTTGTTMACGSDCDYNDAAGLQPFNSSLGTLTGITLHVDATSVTSYNLEFADFGGPSQQTGTAQFSFEGPFNAIVNGVTYSFQIAGNSSASVAGPLLHFYPGTFTATGSGTFTLDSSLFDSFTDHSQACGFFTEGSGICVSGSSYPAPTNSEILASADNLLLLGCFGTCIVQTANYTLTYTYNPVDVPEPTTWAMMLFGFAGMGLAVRRLNRNILRPAREVPRKR